MSTERRIELMPLGVLQGAKRNPKAHSKEIGTSVGRFGYVEPIVLDERTQRIVAGHGRRDALMAMRKKGERAPAGVEERDGEWLVPVLRGWASRSDAEAEAYLLASNKLTEAGGWDDRALAELLKDLDAQDALDGVGFDDDEIARLLGDAGIAGGVDGADADAVPDEPAETDVYVKSGELWLLGNHRLLCGDSTKSEDVARLMNGERADCVWTDPPYGVEYVGKTASAKTISNDGRDGLPELLRGAFASCMGAMRDGAPIYIAHPAGALSEEFLTAFVAAGFLLKQTLVWLKDSMVLGYSDYHYRHEPILYGCKPGCVGRFGRGGTGWFGDNSQTSVFDVPRPKRSEDHPTMKPVELVEKMLINSSEARGVLFEPFSGSGTTIIAAEKTGRRCYAMELEPRYVQVAIERWQKFTGKQATRA